MGSHFWLNLIATTYILLKAFHFHCRLKMIRIIVLLGLFLFISGVHPSPLPPGIDYDDEAKEEVAELLTDLFREAKDIDIEVENNDVDYELVREDKLNTDPDEVAKYNTYMDAVFRRMNAALRAKLMDPMELNLDSKQKKPCQEEKETKNRDKMKRNKQEEKARGSLSGIATLRRTKDVQIMDENGHKILTSYFAVGPLKLSVTKSLGEGQERTIKTAEATTDVMDGVMVLKVKPDGSAHVKKVEFQKPEKVDVTGSLNDAKERSVSRIKNTFNKSRGLAANKLLKAARYVLKSNSKDEESDALTKE